ncbi:MAG: NUDIX hydrolase [Spirochaetales bacterium]|nr:NUDIX hydrolase [Spirochaetales bacterium]
MSGIPRTPPLTVDIIIEIEDSIVIIERRNEPVGLAFPGGFVDYGESCETAARREALEETGLEITLGGLLGVYSDPARDPRGHTVSIVYTAHAKGSPQAGDDARRAFCLQAHEIDPARLVFDHARILADYLKLRIDHSTLSS